jgi:hypothetical protein
MKMLWVCCWLGIAAALTGCATSHSEAIRLTGDPLVDGPVALSQGPAKDKVLWQYRMAAADMRIAHFAEAKQLLDDALARIGNIAGPDASAKKARSVFHEEAKKTFIGEPYERVMAYYYRGILYWMNGEPDNARACFRSGEIEDSDAENKHYSCDYVLLDYLDGFASAKLGGDGSDALKRSRASAKYGQPPEYDPKANVLFFLEFGRGPTKYATGEYHQELRFLPGRSDVRWVVVKVDNQSVQVGPYDDLTFQATTRGGRVMDHILANKAVFKRTTDTVGNVAMVGGAGMAILSDDRAVREAGLGLLAFGALTKLVSSAATAAADTRAWDNLPQYLTFTAMRLPPGQHAATVEYYGDGGVLLSQLTKTVAIKISDESKDLVVFVSDRSSNPQIYEN